MLKIIAEKKEEYQSKSQKITNSIQGCVALRASAFICLGGTGKCREVWE